MLRLACGLGIAALLAAGAAGAQPAPSPTPAPAPGKTVDGVTVTGKRAPTKACSSRDQACIAAVVAELKARYPEQLRKWCDHVEEREAVDTMTFMEINLDRPHPNVAPYSPPAVARTACAPDKKP